jgi:hypothetical protein
VPSALPAEASGSLDRENLEQRCAAIDDLAAVLR